MRRKMPHLSQLNPFDMNFDYFKFFRKYMNIDLKNYQLRLLHRYPMDQDHLFQRRPEEI